MENLPTIRLNALRALLRPVVRFCIRGSNTIQEFVDLAKIVFVEVATEELSKKTKKINVSRLSVMTGLPRKELTRLYNEKQQPVRQSAGVLARVLSQWEQDPRFSTDKREPRVLTFEGDTSEFKQLCETITTNLNAGTILFELERTGTIERTPQGLRLVKQSARFATDPEKGFNLMCRGVDALMEAAQENILNPSDTYNLHIQTEYDNITKKSLPEIEAWLLEEGRAFHRKARMYLAGFDKDVSPQLDDEGGAKVVLGSFSLTIKDQNDG